MQTTMQTNSASKGALWTGRILSGLAVLFLIFDTVVKVFNTAPAIEATTQLGYPANLVPLIGLLELICLVVYIIPRTAVLGAILFTGYLGGAIATHVRNGSDGFSIIFPIIVGLMLWGGLYLLDKRLRALIPLRS